MPEPPVTPVDDHGDRAGATGRRQAASVRGVEGLRERKKVETLRSIQVAARRLVAERGLRKVTVDDIAAAANVSCRTFFNYFDSKEAAVFDATEPNAASSFAAALAARPVGEAALDSLHAAIRSEIVRHAAGLRELGELVRQYPELAARECMAFAVFGGVITQWAAERFGTDPATSIYPMLLAGFAQSVTRIALSYSCPEDGDDRMAAIIDEAFGLLKQGLPLPPRPA